MLRSCLFLYDNLIFQCVCGNFDLIFHFTSMCHSLGPMSLILKQLSLILRKSGWGLCLTSLTSLIILFLINTSLSQL